MIGLVGLSLALSGCTTVTGAVPECEPGHRLALVAQSVRSASYVPCIRESEERWGTRAFRARRRGTSFSLIPGRPGGRPVEVTFDERCDVTGAVATTPRAEGVRTSIRLNAVSPRYSGTMNDVFAGGCVTYRFDFARGPHIALMERLGATVGLFSRRELAVELRDQLGVDLDP